MIVDQKLWEREANGTPIQVAVLGAGAMAMGLVNQIERHTPGMRVAGIFNRTGAHAVQAYTLAGVDGVRSVGSTQDFEGAVAAGQAAVVDSPEILVTADAVDVVVEMTGTIEFAFTVILKAFAAGKPVVSFNAELDATLGPYLQQQARRAGVRYTLGDGDQPGVTMNLYRKVRAMGFQPLLCGNNKGLLDHYRTPQTQKRFAQAHGLSVTMATSFADGTKVSFEQAAVANATGMQVACRGMRCMKSELHVDELTTHYDVGQLQELGGIVEVVVGAHPGPGVFIYATTDDPVSQRFLEYGKMGPGPLYSFYRPYHLLFFEFPFSIVRLLDFADGTLDARERFSVEVLAVAKRDLNEGEIIDGVGGFMVYGVCENRHEMRTHGLLPMGLAEGMKLKNSIPKDAVITWADVTGRPENPLMGAYHLID